MRFLAPVLIAALSFISTPMGAEVGWKLSLQSTRNEVAATDPLLLRVTLENSSASPQVVFKGFWPSYVEDWPATVLRFEITRDDEPVGFLGKLPPGHHGWKPHWSQFEEIPASWFFGTTVNIQEDPWRFESLEPGTYRIRAVVVFHARDWFEKHHSTDPDEETIRNLYPQRELLAGGKVISNEVAVRVRQDKPSGG